MYPCKPTFDRIFDRNGYDRQCTNANKDELDPPLEAAGRTVKNIGAPVWSGTQYWIDQVYISTDPTFIPYRATFLGNFVHTNSTPLGTGDSYTGQGTVTLPRGIGGNYFVYVITNDLASFPFRAATRFRIYGRRHFH